MKYLSALADSQALSGYGRVLAILTADPDRFEVGNDGSLSFARATYGHAASLASSLEAGRLPYQVSAGDLPVRMAFPASPCQTKHIGSLGWTLQLDASSHGTGFVFQLAP